MLPDPLTVALGTLVTGLAAGAFLPRWVVTWLLRVEREKTATLQAALDIERERNEELSDQNRKLMDDVTLSTRVVIELDAFVRGAMPRGAPIQSQIQPPIQGQIQDSSSAGTGGA